MASVIPMPRVTGKEVKARSPNPTSDVRKLKKTMGLLDSLRQPFSPGIRSQSTSAGKTSLFGSAIRWKIA